MPDLESHWFAKRLAYLGRSLTGDLVRRQKASRTFPRLKSDPKAEGWRKPLCEALFVRECRTALRKLLESSDLSQPRKELYRELVVASASDPLKERRGWTASVELGARIELLEQPRVLAHLATCSECIIPCRLELQGGPGRHARLHAFYYCERVRPFWDHVNEWTVRIEPKQPVLLDVGYAVDNVLSPFQGQKRVVFLAILDVARMVIWRTRNKGLYDDANFSHHYLVLYFRHQLRVKIRCDRKRLDRITFSKRWVNAASLVVRNGATLESSFPTLPANGVYGTGPSGPHPG